MQGLRLRSHWEGLYESSIAPPGGQRYHYVELAFGGPMDWTTPSFEEINLNCEISSYANAEL
jgi:hypothetical protein